MNLHQLTGQWLQIQEMIDEGAEIESLTDTLEAIEEAIEHKAVGVAYVIKNNEVSINAIKEEKKRLDARLKSYNNSNARLKEYLQQSLELAEKQNIKTPTMTIYTKNNAESLHIKDDASIPAMYYKASEPTLQKKELLAAIRKGIQIEGVSLKQTKAVVIR
ncbi:TPA: siphovirus Gp157 family protein [Bacillus anthracis]|nr:siphovirus Gp157 family protein [Bacillus cereus biovar anthracis]HDR6230933.1 siphovirus Gp157 family protein [Bacillus cereus biovar anthracis]HDR6240460.1 siphovirus Gp157 family protein [Bacillus cereus biovar anthracis]HDR6252404.1 siphovirus Gp157 family protein [Bacillus cereus biovar anthracis]HDR6254189.1 siphovirus Gp157 family protein [Bacillus cereus biovar anthracis]